jgi:hypothetical protein
MTDAPPTSAITPVATGVTILSIDPGTTNLAAAIFQGDRPEALGMLWHETFSPGTDIFNLEAVAKCISGIAKVYGVDRIVIEDQPAIPGQNQGVFRDNCFVEAYLTGNLMARLHQVVLVRPCDVKRRLHLCTGANNTNKIAALQYAKHYIPRIETDHLADCFLMAKYFMIKLI